MGIGYIAGSNGGGGVTSDEVTAKKENVLAGTTTVTADSDNAVVGGSMKNNGSVKHTLAINGSYTIPKGYHDGTGKVTQSIKTKGGETIYPAGSNITISKNQYLTGDLIVHAITQSGLVAGNIVRGKTIAINNGKQDVWKVAGANNVLKYHQSAEKGNGANKAFLMRHVGQTDTWNFRMYYLDVNLGFTNFTPVYLLSVGNGFAMWRFGNQLNLVSTADTIGGMKYGYVEFVNAADAPFKSNQLRLFYGEYGPSEQYNVWFYVFGY